MPQNYLDLEDDSQNSENTWDEFVAGSDDAEATVPGQEYWMYIDLSDQDSAVTSTRTILEAERNLDGPGTLNWPLEWYTIKDFTAPDSGTWDFTSGSSSSSASLARAQPDADEDRESYISKRKEVLKKLAKEMPEREMRAMVSLSSFVSTADADVLLRDYDVKAGAAWFESIGYGFGGGFSIEGSVAESLAREISDLNGDLARTKETLKKADAEEKAVLKRVLSRQEMMIKALSDGDAKVYGIEVTGKLKELQKLQEDSRVTLVDVKYYPEAQKGGRIVQRPIQPER